MADPSDSPKDHLWQEYSAVFRDFDDLTLARWLCQTLGQLEGRVWRLSHPLVSAYRLACATADDRQIWLKRLATAPQAYWEAPCCRAPLLPFFTRDLLDAGLICFHCGESAVSFEEIPGGLQGELKAWADEYGPIHAVAHWDDAQRKKAGNYDRKFEHAATEAERLLSQAGKHLVPRLAEHYPAIVWEDQDECLEVCPEDIPF